MMKDIEYPWWGWLITLSVGIIMLRGLVSKLSASKLKLPPGPGAYPIVGSFPLLGAIPGEPVYHMFHRLAQKYGPIVFLKMGSCPTVIIADSDIAKVVLRDQDHVFASRPMLSAGKYIGMNFQSLIFSQMGPHYKQLSKIYSSELLSPKRVVESHEVREKRIHAVVSVIYDKMSKGQPTNLTEQLTTLSLNTLVNMVFGQQEGHMLADPKGLSKLKETVREIVEVCGEFNYGDYIPIARWLDLTGIIGRMKSVEKRMRSMARQLIEEHREHRRKTSEIKNLKDLTVLDVLLSLKEEDAITDDCITAVIFDLIVAGSDTTSVAADWTIAELMRNPELMTKVQTEVDSIVGRERHVEESDLPHMRYLHCVIKESLRLHAPSALGLPHCSTEAAKVAGYDIPAGTNVIINYWALHRDPKNWPKADEFRPERFEEHDKNMFGQDFTLLPFSSGRRGCSGMLLGFTMVQLIVASIVHCFDIEAHGIEASEIDVTHEKPGLTTLRVQNLIVKAHPRLPIHLYE